MKSAVSANSELAQEARDAARQAARRAGLSVDEWLRLLIDSPGVSSAAGSDRGHYRASEGSLGSIQERLDELSARLGAAVRPRPEPMRTTGLRELESRLTDLAQNISRLGEETPSRIADSIIRLNTRLDHLIIEGRTASSEFERRIAAVDNALADLSSEPVCRVLDNWSNIEDAAAEIEARQRAIEAELLADSGLSSPALVGLEQQLRYLTKQMENLRRPSSSDEAVADLRRDLSQISRTLSEAMPRRALEALESEVQWLATRVNDGRTRSNQASLSGVERSLAQVYEAIAGLAPAESLAGIESDVAALERKIDLVASTGPTPSAMRQLENAVSELRALSGKVASGQALDNLTDEVRSLSDKIDRFIEPEQAVESTTPHVPGPIERDLAQLREAYLENNRQARESLERSPEKDASGIAVGPAPISIMPDERPAPMQPVVPPVLAEPEKVAAPEQPPVSTTKPRAPANDPIRGLPPDHPLEPGSGAPQVLRASAAERIAASEAVLGAVKPAKKDAEGRANFIAAARRAAQAAAAEATGGGRSKGDSESSAPKGSNSNRRRMTVLSVGAVLLLAGSSHLATSFWSGGNNSLLGASNPARKERAETTRTTKPAPTVAAAQSKAPADVPAAHGGSSPASPALAPSANLVPVIERRQVSLVPATDPVAFAAPAAGVLGIPGAQQINPIPNPAPVSTIAIQPTDVTGSAVKPQVTAALAPQQSEPTADTGVLPDSIGGPRLRAAAMGGDPGAAYEIAIRYAEGKGVPANLQAAAHWFERAASQGIVPAQYRLGSLYEKGRGVKKDLKAARQFYQSAADKGNGKAMHNLAVLFAEGVDGKPDYQAAMNWFRKAAARGVADSQYNLGILYARGIGVEQSLPESYKWFMLAAQQGDLEATRKRDDVGARLDPQSLVAAKLAAQTFTADPQPDDAISVRAPAGGWDRVGTPAKPKGAGSKKNTS